jgi:hypothetical protein
LLGFSVQLVCGSLPCGESYLTSFVAAPPPALFCAHAHPQRSADGAVRAVPAPRLRRGRPGPAGGALLRERALQRYCCIAVWFARRGWVSCSPILVLVAKSLRCRCQIVAALLSALSDCTLRMPCSSLLVSGCPAFMCSAGAASGRSEAGQQGQSGARSRKRPHGDCSAHPGPISSAVCFFPVQNHLFLLSNRLLCLLFKACSYLLLSVSCGVNRRLLC